MFGTLYAAQGIPDAMVLIVFPAFLAASGASASVIGAFLATAMLPNAAKLLVGPLIDRLTYWPMGRRKPWLMAGQAGIACSFAALALLDDPAKDIGLFTAGAFAITLSTVFQDVASDATAMDLIPPSEQGRANGIMWGSKTLGTAGAASAGALILAIHGFQAMVVAASAMLVAVGCLVAMVRERPGERLLPWTRGAAAPDAGTCHLQNWASIIGALTAALRRPAAQRLILLSVTIGLISGMTGALAPMLLVSQFDWSQEAYAQLRSTLKLVSGLAGMVVGGILIDRLGHKVVLVTALALIAAANIALGVIMEGRAATSYLVAFEMLMVFVFITFFAATMRQCAPLIAATQFSFTMVCGNMAMSLGAALLGPVTALGGEPLMLVLIAAVAMVGAATMLRWQPDRPDHAPS